MIEEEKAFAHENPANPRKQHDKLSNTIRFRAKTVLTRDNSKKKHTLRQTVNKQQNHTPKQH